MAVNIVNIGLNDQITGTSDAATDTVYTASAGPTQINQLTVSNSSTSLLFMSFWILPAATAATTCPATWTQAVAAGAGGVLDATTIIHGLLGQTIPSGGSLQCCAGVTNVGYVTGSGVVNV